MKFGGKSYFHSSNYAKLLSFSKKLGVSADAILQNFSFKKIQILVKCLKKKYLN